MFETGRWNTWLTLLHILQVGDESVLCVDNNILLQYNF